MSGVEIVSGAAAIIQLVGYANGIRCCISDLAKKARNPSQSLGDLSNQIKSIIALTKSIKDDSSHPPSTHPAIHRCVDSSTRLAALIDTLRFPVRDDDRVAQRWTRLKVAATWKFKEKEIANIWAEIDRSIAILQLFVSCNNTTVSGKTLEITKRMSEGLSRRTVGGDPALCNSLDGVCRPSSLVLVRMLTFLRWICIAPYNQLQSWWRWPQRCHLGTLDSLAKNRFYGR